MIALILTLFLLAQGGKIPPPDSAAQKSTESLIRELFKEEYARKAPADRSALAKKLAQQASETKDDSVSRYVLLREAKDLAILANDLPGALEIITALSKEFAVDAAGLRAAAIAAAEKSAKTSDELKNIASAWIQSSEDAVAVEDFTGAEKAAAAASQAARKAKDFPLIGRAEARLKEIAESKLKAERLRKARETLAANPQDPAANTLVGQFLLLTKGDVNAALPLLALGTDGLLKTIALKEQGTPADASEQVALGDSWSTLSEKESGAIREALRHRAVQWYSKALPQLNGLSKTKVARRVGEAKNEKLFRGSWIDITDPALFNMQGKKGEPLLIEGEEGFGSSRRLNQFPSGGPFDGFSVRATFKPNRKGDLRVHFEGGARFIFVSGTGAFTMLSRVESGDWKAIFDRKGIEPKDEYLMTVFLEKGEWIIHLDGEEMTRVKTTEVQIQYFLIWSFKTTGSWDQIKLRKKE